jgi:hypothetical protein
MLQEDLQPDLLSVLVGQLAGHLQVGPRLGQPALVIADLAPSVVAGQQQHRISGPRGRPQQLVCEPVGGRKVPADQGVPPGPPQCGQQLRR